MGRGIRGDYPVSLVGYVPDDDRPGAGAIIAVISDGYGAVAGIQVGYLDGAGRKVGVGGAERRQFLIDREAQGLRFHVVPAEPAPASPLLICEGLENALSLAMAFPGAEIIGLPGIGHMKRQPPFAGQDIVVFRDGDAADTRATRTLMDGVDHLLLGGATVKVTDTPLNEDANSILQKSGEAGIQALVANAVSAKLSADGAIKQCAGLSELDYELERRRRAKALGIRTSALDHRVGLERARRRSEHDDDDGEDADIHPEPVNDIAAVLDTARAEVGQYVVANPAQLDMAAVWALHTHFVHHATIDIAISPRLLISAPAPECGKTTLLEAVGELTCRPMEISSISAAAFFRLSDAERPTLLIDEIQGLFSRKANSAEFEGILNASHRRRSAKTVRVEEQANRQLVATTFDAWGTFAATINGRMSYATESRCLKVKLRRALPGEVKKHLTDGTSDVLVECRRKLARWAIDQLVLPDAALPDALANRSGDNWRPLFRIAELVGGHWPSKIRAAAMAAMQQTGVSDVIVAFLADARKVIGQRERILTTELIDALRSMEDPSWDWGACHRGGPINAYWLRDKLADVLDPPGSKEWKVGGKARNGYTADQFNDAYRRYLQAHSLYVQGTSAEKPPENSREDRGISGKASVPSATGTEIASSEQEIFLVADDGDGIATQSASATGGVERSPTPIRTGYPLGHRRPLKNLVRSERKSFRLPMDGIKSGKSPFPA